jgi:hypothetical protein
MVRPICTLLLPLVFSIATEARAEDDDPITDPQQSATAGIGLNATLAPVFGAGALLQPTFGLRLWLERLMIEPLLGFGLVTGSSVPDSFRLAAGSLIGFSLSQRGNLRPIIGGGLTMGLTTGGGRDVALNFGPFFGIEYRFDDFPQLSFDAALLLPFRLDFDPVIFSFGTSGAALIGFHYYFAS